MLRHTSIYRLQIEVPEGPGKYEALKVLLGRAPEDEPPSDGGRAIWRYEQYEVPEDPVVDHIKEFLDALERRYEALEAMGIQRRDISIWRLYAYDSQCNMEFDPVILKRLGDNGINLCISCWDVHDYSADETDHMTNAEMK